MFDTSIGGWLRSPGVWEYGGATLYACSRCLSAVEHAVRPATVWDRKDRWDLWAAVNVEVMSGVSASTRVPAWRVAEG